MSAIVQVRLVLTNGIEQRLWLEWATDVDVGSQLGQSAATICGVTDGGKPVEVRACEVALMEVVARGKALPTEDDLWTVAAPALNVSQLTPAQRRARLVEVEQSGKELWRFYPLGHRAALDAVIDPAELAENDWSGAFIEGEGPNGEPFSIRRTEVASRRLLWPRKGGET